MNFCSFDLEIAKVIPDDAENWDEFRPLGISCAATFNSGDKTPLLFWGDQFLSTAGYAPHMNVKECQRLVLYLYERKERGYVPLTWNGLSFDFRTLAEESGMWDECAELAMNHVDMMFQVLCLKGFPVGLDRACKGMGLAGKPEGMSGALAPVLWQQGEYQKVLDYVAQDVIEPLELAASVERRGWLTWITKKGTFANVMVEKWLTVKECLQLPLPDTSWMDHPITRESFYSWISCPEAESSAHVPNV